MVVGEVWFLLEKRECDEELVNDRDTEDITEVVREEDDEGTEVVREGDGDIAVVREDDDGDIKDITKVVKEDDGRVVNGVVFSVLVT